MKIAMVTLNPAIDQTVRVDNFRPNRVNRALAIKFDASGKGVSYNLPSRDILWQYFKQVNVRKF